MVWAVVVGLDLAGVEKRPSGFCVLEGMRVETREVYADCEILSNIQAASPKIVAIDAPLSLPPGRKTIEQRADEHLREADRELLRRRIRFFPITLGPMRQLTTRGMNLKTALAGLGFGSIEVYPGGAQDVLGIPRKQQGLDKLRVGLEGLGLKGLHGGMSDHELDAVTCAYVGKMFLEGRSVTYGAPEPGIVMPGDRKSDCPS
jgi:predicted nuclease with RNAse H fold